MEGRSGENGITVLMRYTLRLLTLQQFQRAAALICACEDIRRTAMSNGNNRWGKTPFRIGLWVGGSTTPNWTSDSDEAVKSAHGGKPRMGAFGGVGSPHQLTNCPWCGTKIDPGKHIKVEKYSEGAGRTLVGLYETAIDRLCTWEVNGKKIRPKVVCSTATIRNAGDQVYGIFLRNLNIFPPTRG